MLPDMSIRGHSMPVHTITASGLKLSISYISSFFLKINKIQIYLNVSILVLFAYFKEKCQMTKTTPYTIMLSAAVNNIEFKLKAAMQLQVKTIIYK